jgi:hypothetical protein
MGMDVTIGYGGTARREPVRPVFVVRGSEAAAAVADEGWDETEHAFFAGGAVLDDLALLAPASPRPRVWRRSAMWGAALLRRLTAAPAVVALGNRLRRWRRDGGSCPGPS